MSRYRPIKAIRTFGRLGVVLAVLFALLGHTAMGGESDCAPPNGTIAWSADVAGVLDHAVGFVSHGSAHAHTHDATTAAHTSTVAAAEHVRAWSAICPGAMAGAFSSDIERPPRLILVG